jgi:hypothetical protein
MCTAQHCDNELCNAGCRYEHDVWALPGGLNIQQSAGRTACCPAIVSGRDIPYSSHGHWRLITVCPHNSQDMVSRFKLSTMGIYTIMLGYFMAVVLNLEVGVCANLPESGSSISTRRRPYATCAVSVRGGHRGCAGTGHSAMAHHYSAAQV